MAIQLNLKEQIGADLKILAEAIERLEEAIGFEKAQVPARLNIDATIQRFEFSYELCWKLLRKVIQLEGGDCYSPRDCIRIATQYGLIYDPADWFDYLEARNLTVHTYDVNTADQVYQVSKRFTQDAKQLIEAVKECLSRKP